MAIDPTTLFPGAAGDREGAILKIRPENLWQDTARTTAVTTDGDPVRAIDDISVNGRDMVIFDTTKPYTYHTDGTAHWLSSPGGHDADFGMVSVDDWTFMDASPYSVGAAVKFDSPSSGDQFFFGTEPLVGGSSNSSQELQNSIVHCGARNGSTATIGHWFNDQDFSHSFPTTPERHICEYTDPGSEYTIDGTQIDVSATTPDQLDNVGRVTILFRHRNRTDVNENEGMDGNLYGMIILVDTITAQEKSDIDGWLQEQIEGPAEQTVVVGQATETSSATSMVLAVTIVTGQAAETSTATALAVARTFAAGQATETATASAVGRNRALTTGQATETSAATAIDGAKAELALQAAEEDNATAVTITRAWAVGQATESSSATQIAAAGALNIGLAAETAAAQPVGHFRVATLGLGTVTDTAQPVASSRTTLVGQASETNAASSLGHSRLAAVGLANEANTAGDVTATGGAEPEPGEGGFWVIRRRRRWV